MTGDSPPLVPSPDLSSLSSDKRTSSWAFDELQDQDESNSSDDFFSAVRKSVAKNVYLGEDRRINDLLSDRTSAHVTSRVDSSDLISRCRHFLPLITDANRELFSKMKSGEDVRIEIDSDQDVERDERAIEMNLMFCPDVDESSESEQNSDDNNDDDISISIKALQSYAKNNPVKITEVKSTDNVQCDAKLQDIVNE